MGDRDVNFAWPGRDRDAPEAEDDLDFSDENDNDVSSEPHSDENSGSGSETDSGLKVKEKEDEDLLAGSRDAGDANESKVKATLDGDADDTIEKFEPADAGEERKEVEAIRSNNEGKKEDEIQNPGPIEVSSKVDEDEEAAFNNAPTSLEAAQAAE